VDKALGRKEESGDICSKSAMFRWERGGGGIRAACEEEEEGEGGNVMCVEEEMSVGVVKSCCREQRWGSMIAKVEGCEIVGVCLVALIHC
jgi:hypothetical protein